MVNIQQGDCLELIKQIPDNSIDLVLTSPPYDNLRDYNGNISQWNEQKWKNIIRELFRIIKNKGAVVWVVGDAVVKGSETGTSFKQALFAIECGFNLHDTMIYEKNSSTYPASRKSSRYTQIFEYMFVFSKGTPKANLLCDKPNKWAGHTNWGNNTQYNKEGVLVKTNNIKPVPDFSARNNIWRYTVGFNDKTGHPAVFPEQLAKDHILSWSNEGEIVLDPFMGSGTVGKMAKKLNRNFIGFEISPEYFEIAKNRIENHNSYLL